MSEIRIVASGACRHPRKCSGEPHASAPGDRRPAPQAEWVDAEAWDGEPTFA
jgi:hypothetical protein